MEALTADVLITLRQCATRLGVVLMTIAGTSAKVDSNLAILPLVQIAPICQFLKLLSRRIFIEQVPEALVFLYTLDNLDLPLEF